MTQAETQEGMLRDAASSIIDAIRARRSVGRVRPERPPRELIERVLEAAVQAPNHRRTEPWRFIVVSGAERAALGEAMARARAAMPEPVTAAELERERAKPLRAPVLIAVAVQPAAGPRVVEVEEIAAVAAATQNMLLAAQALGLAAMWRTGDTAFASEVRQFLGLPETARVLGLIYVGYPDAAPAPAPRRPATHFTRWLGWEEA